MTNFNSTSPLRFERNFLALSVSLALSSMAGADTNDEVTRLITPESYVSAGIGYVSGEGSRFGMYNGLSEQGGVGLFDFAYNRRNDETGTWYRFSGRNLGLDTRELRIDYERQGAWRYFLEYDSISRVSPYTINTGVKGIGLEHLTVPKVPAGGNDYTLKTERHRTSFGGVTALSDTTQIRLNLQNENKDGERIFGRGTPGSIEFLAEPIHHNTKQIDLVLDYTGDKFQLSGGYYGSFFRNETPVLGVQGGADAFNKDVGTTGVAYDKISLPPDNQAHQLHLAGGYQFSRSTRLNFKVARSVAKQNDDFMAVNFYNTRNNGVSANTSGSANLGGRVDTTLANISLTSRPLSKLSLLANFRYEERDDKTSVARYITNVSGTGAAPILGNLPAASTTDGYNEPRSLTNRSGKLEASYALPDGYKLTGGVDYDSKERSVSGIRVVGYRQKVEENSYRLELKRSMAETLSGSLAYVYSDRTGSDYKNLNTLGGYTYPNYGNANVSSCSSVSGLRVSHCGLIQPIYMADRERQKIRFLSDWSPIDQLSAQFMIEGSIDDYGPGRGSPDIGNRRGEARLYSLDVVYQASDRWKFNTWLSQTANSIDQANIASVTAMSNTGAIVWSSRQKNSVSSLGVGARGKLPKGIELGLDYIYAYDKTTYNSGRESYTAFSSTASPSSLPDIRYRQQTLKLFGTYPLDKSTSFRLDYILDHRNTDDWTWENWVYTDGTRVLYNPDSTIHFVGVSMIYTFR